jgi:hypothetical protein
MTKDGIPEWRVELKPIKDPGYAMNCVTVYAHSFVSFKKEN